MNHPARSPGWPIWPEPNGGAGEQRPREHQEFMTTVPRLARENGAVLAALPDGAAPVFPGRCLQRRCGVTLAAGAAACAGDPAAQANQRGTSRAD